MKRLPSILFILALAILFCGCTIDEYRTINLLGEFPWESVPDYFPYSVGDTLIMCDENDSNNQNILVVSEVNVFFEPFEPVGSQPLFTNHRKAAEIAEKIVKLLAVEKENNNNMIIEYRCIRNDYSFLFNYDYSPVFAGTEYNYSDIVKKRDYNAMFNILPDTVLLSRITYEDDDFYKNDIIAEIVANRGLTKYIDVSNNKVWLLKQINKSL